MGTLEGLIVEEKERLEGLLEYYRNELKKYPKGSVSKKKRNGSFYYYQCYRDGSTVITNYLGKVDSPEVKEMRKKIEERINLEKKIIRVNENLSEAKGLLNGKRKAIS
jgi:hypothetical protein